MGAVSTGGAAREAPARRGGPIPVNHHQMAWIGTCPLEIIPGGEEVEAGARSVDGGVP